jgi:hypothetical protein
VSDVCVLDSSSAQPTAAPTTSPSCSATGSRSPRRRRTPPSRPRLPRASDLPGENVGARPGAAGSARSSSAEHRDVRRSAARTVSRARAVSTAGPELADAVDVLLPEAEPEPRVDQRGVVRRHQRVVRAQVPARTHSVRRPRRTGRGRSRPRDTPARPPRPSGWRPRPVRL